MKYSASHEWVFVQGKVATVGITQFAQKELGDIVYVELPLVGTKLEVGDEVVVVESTKAAIDIYAPLAGEIVEVNEGLRENPEWINESAEKKGWLYKLTLAHPEEVNNLMDEGAYRLFIGK